MVTCMSAIFCSGWPTFLALGTLDLNFLRFTLWSYISCTLHFGPILLALFTLDLYFLHFAHITHNISNPCPVPLMMLMMMMIKVTVSVRMMRQQESRVSKLSAFVSSQCHKHGALLISCQSIDHPNIKGLVTLRVNSNFYHWGPKVPFLHEREVRGHTLIT